MVGRIKKKLLCSHKRTILSGVGGYGINTVFMYKCIDCKYIMTDNINIKTK